MHGLLLQRELGPIQPWPHLVVLVRDRAANIDFSLRFSAGHCRGCV